LRLGRQDTEHGRARRSNGSHREAALRTIWGVTRTVWVLLSLVLIQAAESGGVAVPTGLSRMTVLLQGGGCLARHRLQFSSARDRNR